MMIKVEKTTFEEEQRKKDEAWLKLTPYQRMEKMLRVRMKMRKPNINYSLEGQKVKITRLA